LEVQMSFRLRSLLCVCLLALGFVPASATTITTYSSLTDWLAATTSYQTINFEGLVSPLSTQQYSSVPVGDVQFFGYTSSGAASIKVIDTNLSVWYNFGTNDALMQDMDRPNAGSQLPYIHVVLPAAVTSFG